MYEVFDHPYCYPKTDILRNKLGLRTTDALHAFEALITAQRAEEALPTGRLSVRHFQRLHHHMFQDVYEWAGKFRTVRLTKENTIFCYPEHISAEMKRLFTWLKQEQYLKNLGTDAFAALAAWFFSELNAIHPFREGNGRTQNIFLFLLSENAEHPLNFDLFAPDRVLSCMIHGMKGDTFPLQALILDMCKS